MDLQFLVEVAHDPTVCKVGCGHLDRPARLPDLWVELLGERVLSIPQQRVGV